MVVAQERLFQCPQDGVRRAFRHRDGSSGEEDSEFVAAEARDQMGTIDRFAQASTHLAEQHVAQLMPEAVVDFLEVVDVEQQQHGIGICAYGFLDFFAQHEAVREVG